MKKIDNIAVVSHFALLRSELCDIINEETEYSAESKSFDFMRSGITGGGGTLFIVDLDSFNPSEKETFKNLVVSNNVSGIIVLFGSMDISSVLNPPLKESGNFFIPKPTGHIRSNERFMRNLDIALTRASGVGLAQAKAKTSPFGKPAVLPSSAAAKPASPSFGSAQTAASARPKPSLSTASAAAGAGVRETSHSLLKQKPVVSDEPSFIAHPDQLHVKAHYKCKLSAGGKIADDNLIVAIASSTGGPKALQDFIPMLPGNLDAPVILTQHMPAGFTKSMAERLDEISKIRVKEAEDGELLKKGTVYIAPGGKHLIVRQSREGHVAGFSDEPPVGGLKPCADIMYRSLQFCKYTSVLAVVLTGMGADGTRGIVKLGERKNIYVISQDEASCVVYGMPKSIAEAGYSDEVLPLLSIAPSIQQKVGVK